MPATRIRKGVDHRWGIYLEPMAIWGNLNPSSNMVGYRYNNFGFTLGADYWVMDNLLVGVNTGYSKTLTGIGGTGGDINANIIPFNAYSAFFVKRFYVNGTLGYTFSNYDMEKTWPSARSTAPPRPIPAATSSRRAVRPGMTSQ